MKKIGSLYRPLLLLMTLMLAVFMQPSAVSAHPIDEYLQSAYIGLDPNQVTVEIDMTPGVLVAPTVMKLIDTDSDGVFSKSEGQAYGMRVLHDVSLSLDEQAISLSVSAVQMPDPLMMKAGGGEIRVTMAAAISPTIAVSHRLAFMNSHAPVKSAHQVSTLMPKASQLVIVGQNRSASSEGIAVDFQLVQVTNSAAVETAATEPLRNIPMQQSQLLDYLRQSSLTPSMVALALVLAVLLGGMHALTPGHGKTIVAAYLVGSRGTVRHAVLLGLIVTITHTASVIIIGVLALLASHFVMPSTLMPLLEMASGVLVVALGVRLLWARWRTRHVSSKDAIHEHGFGPHTHSGITNGGILAMGVSGGLVPCPEALGVLLIAVGLGRFALGLGLIVMFSLGLAAVLIGLGVLVVQARPLLRRFDSVSRRWQQVLPMVGAGLVTVLGGVLLIRGVIAYGL